MPAPDTLAAVNPPDIPAATSEDQSSHAGDAASASLSLLDFSTDWGHQQADTLETSIADASTGAGSINLIGTPIQETSADNAGVGLHIAPLTDGGFTAGALFGPAASAPAPFALANLAPLPFAGHGAEPVLGPHNAMAAATSAEPAAVHLITEPGVDAAASAADIASLAFLENSGAGSPIADSAVGSGGATASQVQAALDESGLSVNGSGIKVGVLSDSFNDLGGASADEANGALPSTVQVLEDISNGGADEGRAMMQIIHDIAPGAGLAFYTADVSEQDFANGILALAAAGCKVICDDVGYLDEPYFQNGVVAQAIQTVEAEGVTYVTAAGNEGSNGYQASFTAGSGTFDGVALTNAENFGSSLTQTITINTEGTGDGVPLTLEWNQAYGAVTSSTADLELLVFHNGSLVATATNTNNQFTNEAGNPWTAYDFASSGTYQIAIENMSGSSTDAGLIFKEITWGDGLPATISGANTGTVVGHSMTPGAITAGAVSAADTPAFGFSPTNESFSSSGAGTELLFANNGTPLSSPDPFSPVAVSSVDDIATTVPGGLSDFYGTSAASASLAGVAALILAANPSLTPAQVEAIMEQTADPMGNSAVAGAGLVQVDPAVAAALQLLSHITVSGTSSEVLQGGSPTPLLSLNPVVSDHSSTTLSSATIKIANAGGSAVAGDELFTNGVQNGSLGNGVTASWNATTDTLTLSGTASLAVYETLLGEAAFRDTGTDTSSGSHPVRTVTWTVNDGTNSYNATSQIAVDRVPGAANNSATETVGATITTTTTNGVLSNASDLDGDSLTVAAVSDTAHGAGTVGSSLAGTYGHLTLNANGSYSYVADNTTAISSAPTGSHLQDVFSYTVSDGHGGTAGASLTVTLDRPAAVTASNETLSSVTTVTASSLFSATDPDGNTIATYAFENTGAGHFLLNGVAQPTNQEIDVTAPQLSQLTYQDAAGSADILEVRVNDGTAWSGWTSFTVTGPALLLQTDGSTALTEVGNAFYLDNISSGTGPELKYGGSPATTNVLGPWVPIGSVQLSGGGYDVAFYDASAGLYVVWTTDSNGNYVSNAIGAATGNSPALEALEPTFGQDLNGDGHIGMSNVIQVDASTALTAVGNDFFLDNTSSGTGPELQFGGAAVTPTMLGPWTPIGAVALSGGYDVAFHDAGAGLYLVWTTDSNGNYVSNAIGAVTGNSPALEALEPTFGQDLNGDGHVGTSGVIQIDGSTALTGVGSDFFLYNTSSGTGPELKFGGAPVTPTMLGPWTPIGAVALNGGGYDVAFHDAKDGLYTVWTTDSNGNYVSNPIGALSGNDPALEALETTFGQDINGDGTIGTTSTTHTTSVAASKSDAASSVAGSSSDNFHFGSSASGQTSTAPGGGQSGPAVIAGHDGFTFPANSAPASDLHHLASWTDIAPSSNSALANIHAALETTHDDVIGSAVVPDAVHLWAHHGLHFF